MIRLTDRCPTRSFLLLAVAALCACAAPGSEMSQRMETSDAEIREEIEALKRAVESSYDRERALAERLQRLEEGYARLESPPEGRTDYPVTTEPKPVPVVPGSENFDVQGAYDRAYQLYGDLQYEAALAGFGEIVSRAANSEWSDNARYWMGECQYGLGKYRLALAEFTKVFSYMETEKADDAQLKIARCYLALGEKENALSAFRKLLDEYPDSEYIGAASKEMRYLEGP